ncbi:MAG: DUF3179 domain-containing protein [Acidimicrobiia bacterium]
MRRHHRFGAALAAITTVALLVAGTATALAADPQPQPLIEPSPREPGPSALDDQDDPAFPKARIDTDDLLAGGPPPDGIPAVDNPLFESAGDVDWLGAREPVLAFEIDGDARAYPVQILTWHEIVNDTVAGVPVAITYCPLCNSAIAYDRRLGDRILDFGVSGLLYRSDLVMYDRQTESLWVQFLGQAVVGRLAGEKLEPISVSTVAWRDWRTAHPDGLVLSRDTGFDRDYGRNPYPGYDDERTDPFLLDEPADPKLPAKARIVGIERDGAAAGITLRRLRKARIEEVDVGGPVVVWHAKGTASGLDDQTVADGIDVGATGAFDPVVDGQHLNFEPAGKRRFRDVETGSTWDILGRAVEGPLAGRALAPVVHVDTFWFAWSVFVPNAAILR